MSTTTKIRMHRVDAPRPPERAPAVTAPRDWRTIAMNSAPNLIVFSLLAGMLYLGHHTGWKMPKSTEIWGQAGESARRLVLGASGA